MEERYIIFVLSIMKIEIVSKIILNKNKSKRKLIVSRSGCPWNQ
jgi:hypothetical protein